MKREEALKILLQNRNELALFGLRRLALFGSVARNEAAAESDIDILVEFDGELTFDVYANLNNRLEDLLGRPVDLVTPSAVRPFMREAIEEDAYEIKGLSTISR